MKDPLSFWLKVAMAFAGMATILGTFSWIDKVELRRELAAARQSAKRGDTLCAIVKHRLFANAREMRQSTLKRELVDRFLTDSIGDGVDAIGLCVPGFDFGKAYACKASGDFLCVAEIAEEASRSIPEVAIE